MQSGDIWYLVGLIYSELLSLFGAAGNENKRKEKHESPILKNVLVQPWTWDTEIFKSRWRLLTQASPLQK